MRPVGRPEELEKRRVRAINLLQQGLQPVEVARQLGVDRRTVRSWKAAFRKRGLAGIKSRPTPGRPIRLTRSQMQSLRGALMRGPRRCGFTTDLWTCSRVRDYVKSHFNVTYHSAHLSRIMHAFGWSVQRPQRRAIERDEKAIQHWVKNTWPNIKKKPHA